MSCFDGLQLPQPAAAEALAKFEAFLDATPELGVVWAQDAGDTLMRALKKRFAATRRRRESLGKVTFATWCAAQPDPDNLLPESHPIYQWAETMGCPEYFIYLAWQWFVRNYGPGGIGERKKYDEWLRVFGDSVKKRYGRLWYIDNRTGVFTLTTDGQILAREFPDEVQS